MQAGLVFLTLLLEAFALAFVVGGFALTTSRRLETETLFRSSRKSCFSTARKYKVKSVLFVKLCCSITHSAAYRDNRACPAHKPELMFNSPSHFLDLSISHHFLAHRLGMHIPVHAKPTKSSLILLLKRYLLARKMEGDNVAALFCKPMRLGKFPFTFFLINQLL